jgi:peptide/nickel transport system ATP-binding protein
MLDIKNLTIWYEQFTPAVEGFSLSMQQGEVVGIVGESGSGKTTVIKSIMGALPDVSRVEGAICFNNQQFKHDSQATWRSLRGTRLAMIFQDCGSSLNPIRTIGKQFVEYIRIHQELSRYDAWNRALQMLDKMHLPDTQNIMNSYPHQLSGGMRQRVGIAMAMTFEPELLLADEPTSALDVTTQAQIVNQMLELRSNFNTSIIIVTHNLGVAAHMAEQLVVMKNGKVIEQGKTEDIIHKPVGAYTKKLLDAIPEIGGRRFV